MSTINLMIGFAIVLLKKKFIKSTVLYIVVKVGKGSYRPTLYRASGSELIPVTKRSAHRWLCHESGGRAPLTFLQTCGYLSQLSIEVTNYVLTAPHLPYGAAGSAIVEVRDFTLQKAQPGIEPGMFGQKADVLPMSQQDFLQYVSPKWNRFKPALLTVGKP